MGPVLREHFHCMTNMFYLAFIVGYKYCWSTGASKLLPISIHLKGS